MKPIFVFVWILVLSLIQSCNAAAQNITNIPQQIVAREEKSGEQAFAQAAITSRPVENASTNGGAIAPTTSAPEERAKPIDALVELWNDANDRCRGGAGDSSKTLAACEERERIGIKLTRLGHCHGKNDQISADMRWHKCNTDSITKKEGSQAGYGARSNEVVSAPTPAQSEPSANGQQHLSSKASIDCAKVATQSNNPVAHILCSGIDGAAADWDLNSTLWAVIGSKNDIQKKAFHQDQQTWRDSLNTRCALQRNMSAFTEDQKKCVLEALHKRATILRASLSGDILAESRVTPEQHAEIQKSLIDRGLMKGAPNGEFDENTRQAIKEFQKATGSAQTGFLSAEQVVQLRQNTPSSATKKDATDGSSLTQAELDLLRARLTKLWNVPTGQERPEELIVDIRIHLGRDRKLSAVPEIVSRGSSPRYKGAADAAVRAVIQGQPYDMLKDDTYDTWKDMIVTFDPRQMFNEEAGTVASKPVQTDTVFPEPTPKTFDQSKISELLDKRDPTRHYATGEPSQSPKRDPDDVVAMVLNYSTFGKDDGENGSFWYRDGSEGCVYKRHLNKISTADAKVDLMLNMLSVTGPERLDLNELDPQNLRSGYDEQLWQDYGYMTVVEHIDQLITASRKSLDNDRLKRGWALIYKKYCTGKKKPF